MAILLRIVFTLAVLIVVCTMAKCAFEGDIKSLLCNNERFNVDPSHNFTSQFLNQNMACTQKLSTLNCHINQTYSEGHMWGHGACSLQLTNPDDCIGCRGRPRRLLHRFCEVGAMGAQIRLGDCSLRYEPYPFTTEPLEPKKDHYFP